MIRTRNRLAAIALLLSSLPTPVQSWAADGQRPLDRVARARRSMSGFMVQVPSRLPGPQGHDRPAFGCALPPRAVPGSGVKRGARVDPLLNIGNNGPVGGRSGIRKAAVPGTLYNSVEDFVSGVLSTADPSVTVVIAIPSRTRPDKAGKTKEVKDQDQRADAALELLARLFVGATGYRALGSYLSESGEILRDDPIMIESLASKEEVNDKNRLRQLGEFARRLARETDQESVFVAVDNTRHYIGRGK